MPSRHKVPMESDQSHQKLNTQTWGVFLIEKIKKRDKILTNNIKGLIMPLFKKKQKALTWPIGDNVADEENLKLISKIMDSKGKLGRFLIFDEKQINNKSYCDLYFKVFEKYISNENVNIQDAIFITQPGYPHWKSIKNSNKNIDVYYKAKHDAFFISIKYLSDDKIGGKTYSVLNYAAEQLTQSDFSLFISELYKKIKNPDLYFQVAGEYIYYDDKGNFAPDGFSFSKFADLIKLSVGHSGKYLVNAGGYHNMERQPDYVFGNVLLNMKLDKKTFLELADIIYTHNPEAKISLIRRREIKLKDKLYSEKPISKIFSGKSGVVTADEISKEKIFNKKAAEIKSKLMKTQPNLTQDKIDKIILDKLTNQI